MNNFRQRKLAAFFVMLLILGCVTSAAAAGEQLYVVAVCRDANAVEIIDGDTMKSLARIPVGEYPHEAIVSADGQSRLFNLNICPIITKLN